MAKTVSLVLGSGGARGLTHIGIIEELEKRGYKINAISGSSIGAAVAGVYAAGKLQPFKKWLKTLTKLTVFRLMDFTLSTQGIVKGDRIIAELESLIGTYNIEELPINYTAVSVDLHTGQEVWINKGSLFEAIRASAAIPTFVTPFSFHGREFIDGGVLNPTPIEPVLKEKNDLLIVVNINARTRAEKKMPEHVEEEMDHYDAEQHLFVTSDKWIEQVPTNIERKENFTVFGIINRSMELMMQKLSDFAIYHYQPDLVINIPHDTCTTFEFYKAAELIQLGKEKCSAALDKYEANKNKRTDFSNIKSVLREYLPLRFDE